MQTIGFNFTKIHGEKISSFKNGKINTDIEFKEISKDKLDILKDQEAIKIDFRYNLDYEGSDEKSSKKAGVISFEGTIVLSTTKEETKEVLKHWKKKEISPKIKIPLFNLIMKRCASKSLQLQEDVGLPSHIQIPKLHQQQQN